MTVIERCVVVEMTCGDVALGVIYGAVILGMISSAVVENDCLRLVSVAVHGSDDRPL